MQGAIRRAAQSHIHDDGIFQRLFSDDITGLHIVFHQLHDFHAAFLGKLDTGGQGSGNGSIAGEGQPQGFAQAVHGVGGKHTGAGAAGGTGGHFAFTESILINDAGFVGTYCLKHLGEAGFFTVDPARHHGTAGTDNAGDVQPQSSHHHARDNFVAVGNQYQTIKAVGRRQGFHGVCN